MVNSTTKTTPVTPSSSAIVASQEAIAPQAASQGQQVEKGIPTQDNRDKTFFRVKIGGTSGATKDTAQVAAQVVTPDKKTEDAAQSKKVDGTAAQSQVAPTGPQFASASTQHILGNTLAPDVGKFDSSNPNLQVSTQFKIDSKTKFAVKSADADPISKLNLTSVKTDDVTDTPRELIFDSLKGDFLGAPYLTLSSSQHATVKFVINDPDDSIRPMLAKLQNVEVEMGFVAGFRCNKFVGVIYTLGRRLPSGTEVEAIDTSYQLQATSADVNSSVATGAIATPATAPAGSQDKNYKVKSSFTGEASFYGGGDGFAGKPTANGETFDDNKLTAAHKTLPFNTMVRVTNLANNKTTVVRVNDRGPYAGGRVMDLSYGAAKAIDMVSAGHANIKGEVLDDASANSQTAATPIARSLQVTPKQPVNSSTPQASQEAFLITAQPVLTKTQPLAATYAAQTSNLKFAQSSTFKVGKSGEAQFQQSKMAAAELESVLQGKQLVARGNTLSAVGPGEGKSSGVTLDYKGNRAAFIGHPVVTKRTGVHLQSGWGGGITVQGWDVNGKQTVGATALTPGQVLQHPTGVIQAPDWGTIKLANPILPGGHYTWADATKNGAMVPESKEVMQGIVDIAAYLEQWAKEIGFDKVQVSSWYRTRAHNAAVGGAKNSYHMRGCAVDFYFPGYMEWFHKMQPSWIGGMAFSRGRCGQFVHGDTGPKRTWEYPP